MYNEKRMEMKNNFFSGLACELAHAVAHSKP